MSAKSTAVILDLGNVGLNWDVEGILASLNMDFGARNRLRAELFSHQDWLDLDHGVTTEAEVLDAICARSPLSPAQVEATLEATKRSMQPLPETLKLMQEIDAAAMSMWLSYRHMEFEDNGVVETGGIPEATRYEDFQYVKFGALINF